MSTLAGRIASQVARANAVGMLVRLGATSVERTPVTGSLVCTVADFGARAPLARALIGDGAVLGERLSIVGASGVAPVTAADAGRFVRPLVGTAVDSMDVNHGVLTLKASSEHMAGHLRSLFGPDARGGLHVIVTR